MVCVCADVTFSVLIKVGDTKMVQRVYEKLADIKNVSSFINHFVLMLISALKIKVIVTTALGTLSLYVPR
ncbi:hypothetical protein L596_013281 [Steinernema carpocapsae]|uniref:Uncharacterized protein n=1 Tax=Steinernema carpocapsae TaxID=34508 RepID=A0A4U5NZN7_STECR|nr:hypothetical protein L596_013281 [Steinernema carpocapsae]